MVHLDVANILYNQKIGITYMVRTQLYIFTQKSTMGIQLHVSALYIGHVRFYCKFNNQLHNMCVGETRSLLTLVGGMALDHYRPVLI
jgi:hypothetical protein